MNPIAWNNAIAVDKLRHSHIGNVIMLVAIMVLYAIAYIVQSYSGIELYGYVPFASLTTVYVTAVGKEWLDSRDSEHHTADVWDAVWTVYQPTLYFILFYFILLGRYNV